MFNVYPIYQEERGWGVQSAVTLSQRLTHSRLHFQYMYTCFWGMDIFFNVCFL